MITAVLSALLAALLLSACGNKIAQNGQDPAAVETPGSTGDRLRIVATIFPEYDWVRNILGDRAQDVELTLLLNNGTDLHSFQPTADDILKISDADLFLYVGGESDAWVEDTLRDAVNRDMTVINLLDVLGDRVREEEIVEGMEAEEEHHDHEDADHGDEEEPEYDEHVWLSLKNASVLCDAITDALDQIDPDGASVYDANAAAYKERLTALDADYRKTAESASEKTLLFADRFPFRYLADDYGLRYYAAFVGCSAETEASFETIIFLAGKTDELALPAILTIDGSDQRIAKTVRDNTKNKDQAILTLNSMQSTTDDDIRNGADYLGIMTENLEVLKKALR
ncbi:MAG: metal ABC transporter substrate-binding protein [Lachnospiraceae bacterium]|nr:metal ABC transporter substrate-binding protein [Lachnospiraceae bacterium]